MKVVVCGLILFLSFALNAAADSSGSWIGTFTLQGGDPQDMLLILNENVGRVTGTGGSTREDQRPITYGAAQNGKLSLETAGPDGAVLLLNLEQSGEVMTGTVQFKVGTDVLTGSVSLKRGD